MKILWAKFFKLFNHLIAFTSVHAVLYYLHLSDFCGQIFKNIFFFLDLIVQKLFFNKSHWFQLLSMKNEWIILLFLILVTLYNLSLNHSIMSPVDEGTSFGVRWKLYCYFSPSQLRRENFLRRLSVFLLYFSFSLFSLLRPLLQIKRVWLIENQQNVVTKSP